MLAAADTAAVAFEPLRRLLRSSVEFAEQSALLVGNMSDAALKHIQELELLLV